VYEFKLPDLGEGIHEAEIVKVYVEPGGTVEQDGSLVEVESDKASVTIPSPVAGTVVELAGAVGDTVHVGQVLARIDTGQQAEAGEPRSPATAAAPAAGARPDQGAGRRAAVPAAHPGQPQAAGAAPAAAPQRTGGPVPAAPATRRLARELGVDIDSLSGSGPAGRITPEDVQRAARAAPKPGDEQAAPGEDGAQRADEQTALGGSEQAADALADFARFGPVEAEALRSIRRKTAERMARAWREIPHVSHFDEADVTELEAFRQRHAEALAEQTGARPTLLAFVAKAAVRALREQPQFNASLDMAGQRILYKRYYNLGLAVATERGLLVPVLRDADRLSLAELAAGIAELARRGRAGELEPADFQGATFTLTNMGPVGGTAATPIINPPEAAILAVMRAADRAVVRDGRVEVRHQLPLVLSFDHRLIDGADAAAFVGRIVELLGDPERLLLQA
jgi:pyruvate dehydrogenase E2 component (dihydrolipoamide acetyltransferase)